MTKLPEGYPLKPYDMNNQELVAGDAVIVVSIPDWLVSGMESSSAEVIRSCEGMEMKIHEIDEYGYVWLESIVKSTADEYVSERFTVEPKNLKKLKVS